MSVSWSCYGENLKLPMVVSYFTDAIYMREAFELLRSCQALHLDFLIEKVPDQGSWEANTHHKPTYLLEVHKRYPERNLLWVDADGRMRQAPTLLSGLQCEVAYHVWRGKQVASGTVFLRSSAVRAALLQKWIDECAKHVELDDQTNLGRAVSGGGFDLCVLPVEYCWIYDINPDTGVRGPMPHSTPVIEHLQASRMTRKRRGK